MAFLNMMTVALPVAEVDLNPLEMSQESARNQDWA
jgi:hypothetical protein